MRLSFVPTAPLTKAFFSGLLCLPLGTGCGADTATDTGSEAGASSNGVAGRLGVAGSFSSAGSVSGAGTASLGGSGNGQGGTPGAPAAGSGGQAVNGGAMNGGSGGISNVAGASGNGGASAGAAGKASAGGSAGSSAGSAGVAGSGGNGASAPDCNSVTGQSVVTVGPSGASFKTVQAALNSLSKTNTTPTQIRIAPGTYQEKLSIQVPNITLCGQAGKASSTILTFSDNANTSNGNGGTLGTTGGASTNLSSNDVSVENITFANSTPVGGSQAVALLVSGNQVQFRNCRFLSFQDTLYVRKAKQYFKDCYVEGTVDFIFGDATAVFDNCTVKSVSGGGTAVSAPNTDQAAPVGLVFLGGQLTADASVKAGSTALGRNWGAYGAAAYLRTALGAHISGVGWSPMGTNTLDTARFSEYKTTGPGATISSRASQAKQLSDQQSASYTLPAIFGAWLPSFSK